MRKDTERKDASGRRLVKLLCGGFVAAALVILPLPALADNEDPAPPTAQTQEQPATEQSAQPTTLTEQPIQPAGTLEQPASTDPETRPQADTHQTPTQASNNTSGAQSDSQTTTTTDTSASAADATIDTRTDIKSDATSGDAIIKDSRDVSNATTGDAEANATVLNLANANGVTAGDFQTFNCDIRQDIQGNIVIDPTTLLPFCSNTPANSSATGNVGGSQGLQSGSSLVEIMNKIVLSAISGSATLEGNRDAGNAATGDATALANVVNIANTAISAQRSFLGVINIHSNLQGDILVPQSLVDSLAGSGSVASSGSSTTDIRNTIDANASSGAADVTDNRTGGNAISGDAATSLMVMNLTGQEVVAKNSLLVFVNVLGKWMGMIVPAPGSNTAMLGSGIQTTSGTGTNHTDDSTTRITNDISVSAQSGDATITGNRDAGNATTGRASAGVNLLNITNSNFKLDDWFGALFINVLGSWLGNFDIQKAISENGGQPPVSDVQVYQLQQPASVTPAPTAAPVAPNRGVVNQSTNTREQQPVELTEASSTAGNVLGSSTRTTINDDGQQGVKLDLMSLIAVITALTLAFAMAAVVVRRRLSA